MLHVGSSNAVRAIVERAVVSSALVARTGSEAQPMIGATQAVRYCFAIVVLTLRRLRSPPIQEALVELRSRFSVPAESVLAVLPALHERLASRYPKAQKQLEWTATIGPATAASSETREAGLILTSPTSKYVVQTRVDGLRVSRLAPYEHWDGFIAEVKNVWAEYVRIVKPESVRQLGVRFINRFSLSPDVAVSDFFATRPVFAADLPQTYGDFFFRASTPVSDKTTVLTTQFSQGSGESALRDCVLDIDAVHVEDYHPESADVWSQLQALRELKNRFFFGSITQKAIDSVGGEL